MKLNYFEILRVDENVSDEQVLAEAYSSAKNYWQSFSLMGIGDENERNAKAIIDEGLLDAAYEILTDSTRRERYKNELDRQRNRQTVEGVGAIKVNFNIGGGHRDYSFTVIENPVRHPIQVSGSLAVGSIQEYVCRTWEEPELGLNHLTDRSLERWIYYSAGEKDISNAIKYFQWEPRSISNENRMYLILDLLQARYPVPILPRSSPEILEKLAEYQKPQFIVAPRVINFGLIPQGKVTATLVIKHWKQDPGKISASCDNPSVQLNVSRLNTEGVLTAQVAGSDLNRGTSLRATITITSEVYGERKIPVFGARFKWMGNKQLGQTENLAVAHASNAAGDYEDAARLFLAAGAQSEAQKAELSIIQDAYRRHEWQRVVDKVRVYHARFGRQLETLTYLIEAMRIVGGTYYQLKQQEIALPYLSALAYETPYLPNGVLPATNWTVRKEAQVVLRHDDPRADWIKVTEDLGLVWTHSEGRADRSKYVGPMPIELANRQVVWRSGAGMTYKPPVIVIEGTLILRTRDNKVVGINAASGKLIWTHSEGMNGRDVAAPVAGKNNIIVADPNGTIYGLEVETGKVKWRTTIEDPRDISLAVSDGILYVGTGTQIITVDSGNGTVLGGTSKMKGLFGFGRGINPVSVTITNDHCLFQTSSLTKKLFSVLDLKEGTGLDFDMPMGVTPPVTWTSYQGQIYIPMLVNYEIRCRQSDGNRTWTETKSWQELHLYVYFTGVDSRVAFVRMVVKGTAYESNSCDTVVTGTEIASACAAAPVTTFDDGKVISVTPYEEGMPLHRAVAASFGNEVYYWVVTESLVKLVGNRIADSKVQSILFSFVNDMVVTERSLSTSLLGSTVEHSSIFYLDRGVGAIQGIPGIYGDVIYVVSRSGEAIAIGR